MKASLSFKSLAFLIVTLVTFVISCGDEDESNPEANIDFHIVELGTDKPIPAAKITLTPNSGSSPAETDFNGEATIKGIEMGNYNVTTTHHRFEENGNYQLNINNERVGDSTSITERIKLSPKPPIIRVSNTSLDFGADDQNRIIQIYNDGGGTLEWNISESTSWISPDTTFGTIAWDQDAGTTLGVTVDRSSLSTGPHGSQIIVISNGGEPHTVDVTIAVESLLTVEPTDIDMGLDSVATFFVENRGDGTVNYWIEPDRTWLNVLPEVGAVGTQKNILHINIDREGLEYGDHTGRIIVNSNETGSKEVFVQILVPDPDAGILKVSPDVVNFSDNENTKLLTLENIGVNPLSWSAEKSQSWLSVNSNSNILYAGQPQSLELTVSREEFGAGEYEDRLRFTSDGGNVDVDIQMTVAENPLLYFTPDTLDFGEDEPSMTLQIVNNGNSDMTWQLSTASDWIGLSQTGGLNTNNVIVTIERDQLPINQQSSGDIFINANEAGEGRVLVLAERLAPNEKPTATFTVSPEEGDLFTEFTFDASGVQDDRDSPNELEVRWRWQNNGSFTDWTLEKIASRQYPSTGQKTVTLEVKDLQGEIGSVTRSITVRDIIEIEPNDTDNLAQEVALDRTVEAEIGYSGDSRDWFKVRPTQHGTLQFLVSNLWPSDVSSGDLGEVKIYDTQLDEITLISGSYLDAGESRNSNIFPVTANNDYYIRIIPENNTHKVPYSVSAFYDELVVNEIAEETSSSDDAMPLGSGAVHEGTVGFGNDNFDWFSYVPEQHGRITIQVNNLHESGVSFGRLNDVVLYDENLTSMFNPSSYVGPNGQDISRPVSVEHGRTYYLSLKSYQDHFGSPYSITVNLSENLWPDAFENNDNQANASMIEPNQTYQATVGFEQDQEDWYYLTLQENGLLQVSVENTGEANTFLGSLSGMEIYNSDFEKLTYGSTISPNYSRSTDELSIENGLRYYISVGTSDDGHKAPYLLRTNFQSRSIIDQFETNDLKSNASLLEVNQSYEMTIGYAGDTEDWYKIDIPSDGILRLEIVNLNKANVALGRIGSVEITSNNQLSIKSFGSIWPNYVSEMSSKVVRAGEQLHLSIQRHDTFNKAPYRVTSYFEPTGYTDTSENNNSSSTASTLEIDGSLEATAGYDQDTKDWYVFIPPSDGLIQFQVSNLNESGLIYGDLGDAIMYDKALNAYDNTIHSYNIEDAETSTSSRVPVTGGEPHYILIQPKDENHAAPYRLQIDFTSN